ncbi:TPA: GLPGLI family protein [Elizabethkingia anophelis]|uniref:GLPGLI family protein n=1 Tax=Elizabethkingia anophelis TaxID=1117645 RepID=UPI0037302352
MRIILLLCALTINIISAQTRFIYEYKSIPDTLRNDSIIKEIMILDIDLNRKESVFASLKKIKSDSLMLLGKQFYPDSSLETRYTIYKNLNNKDLFFYTANYSGVPVQKIRDGRSFNWTTLAEVDKMLGYSIQKAVIYFAGRDWEAWFTTDIPFSDGPYKFNGLPGLIVKISDTKKTHCYELIAIQNISQNYFKVLNALPYQEAKEVSLERYEKEVKDMLKDPMAQYRKDVFEGKILFNNNQERDEYLKKTEVILKNALIHNNNPIELIK